MSIGTEIFRPGEATDDTTLAAPEVSVEARVETLGHEHRKAALVQEINEQIPFLAHGLSDKLAENGLRGKVSVRGVMGEAWGIGVSKDNPRKDIPNVVVYPEAILNQKRSVTNAQLRHEIGHLNYSLDSELADLKTWCADNDQSYELMAPLIEAVQTASVDYLEMRNSIADDPADAFRPLYREVLDVGKIAETIGSGAPYKQAVEMTLIRSLACSGLVPLSVQKVATAHASMDMNALFTDRTQSIIEQAIRSSSGRIKIQLIRDYLWPEFSKLIPEGQLNESPLLDSEDEDGASNAMQHVLEKSQKNLQKSPEESAERQAATQALLQEFKEKGDKLQNELKQAGPQGQSTDLPERHQQDAEQNLSPEQIKGQLAQLEELVEQLNNPELIDQAKELEHFAYDIREVGINEQELTDEQRELLGKMREFCQKTSVLYAKTMRFVMQAYQERNPNFTDSMMERMMQHHHDTPSFTMYSKEAGKDFIENDSPELGIGQFDTDGFLLNFNLPKLIGRFWYRGGNGNLSQPVEEGAIEWGHFYRACMPAIWNSVDLTVRQQMLFDRINAFGQHDYQKYYYLYDVTSLPFKLSHESLADSRQQDGSESGEDGNAQADGENGTHEAGFDAGEVDGSPGGLGGSGETNGGANSEFNEHEEQGQGGIGNSRGLHELFSQLQDIREKMASSLVRSETKKLPIQEFDLTDEEMDSSVVGSIKNLAQTKQSQQRQLEAFYREQSGLAGESLDRYMTYREATRNFTSDLVEYFTEKFKLDKDYSYVNNQRRGARLQKGWANRIIGTTAAGPVIEPAVFERKSIRKNPQFVWSLIIDNSGSCEGDIIEEEKKTAVALLEAARQLNIPLEIVTFGGSQGYQFIKTFDQDLFGDELEQLVWLDADQGTPDVATLNAACKSVEDYADQFNRPYNFVYFMTDGESGSGSIASVINEFKRNMVITGIGLAGAAHSIARSWGRNSIGVEDVKELADVLIRKIEDQIEETFD